MPIYLPDTLMAKNVVTVEGEMLNRHLPVNLQILGKFRLDQVTFMNVTASRHSNVNSRYLQIKSRQL